MRGVSNPHQPGRFLLLVSCWCYSSMMTQVRVERRADIRVKTPLVSTSFLAQHVDMHLTSLPAEIRMLIYRMVLCTPDSLIVWVDPSGVGRVCARNLPALAKTTYYFSWSEGASMMDYNQLKYVCRQLYQETRGLECRYNHVSITRNGASSRSQQRRYRHRRCRRGRSGRHHFW